MSEVPESHEHLRKKEFFVLFGTYDQIIQMSQSLKLFCGKGDKKIHIVDLTA